MGRTTSTTTLDADTLAAITAAVTAVLAGQQATAAPVVAATTSTPGFAKAGKGLVWFVKTDGSKVRATPKQATAWDKLRAASQARAVAVTPEQRAATAAKQSEFLSNAAVRKEQREAIKPLNRVLAAANGGTWVSAQLASAAVLKKAEKLMLDNGVSKKAVKAALAAAEARKA